MKNTSKISTFVESISQEMNPIIKESLENSMSYQEYRDIMSHLVAQQDTSGAEKTEALINYTKLNDRRMKRWDKTVKINEEAALRIANLDRKMTWLVITESWCGDAAHVIPVLNKLAELNPNIDLRLVLRDENLELMDLFLTNGGRAIAKVIMLDAKTGEVFNTYGPRPSEATVHVEGYKAEHGKLTPQFKEDLQVWYNKDKGANIIEDVTKILCNYTPTACT